MSTRARQSETFDEVAEIYDRARPGYPVFLADAVDGGFIPATLEASDGQGGVTLLPHVPPDASGNLCRDDVPGFP